VFSFGFDSGSSLGVKEENYDPRIVKPMNLFVGNSQACWLVPMGLLHFKCFIHFFWLFFFKLFFLQ
jgi:hypothetical protein